ncbi:MAG TPA: gluconeogenesis factor YvcK family protein [Vicinamibacterales bacterium]|nr:gluconeogenesis factor YvcK family protein [Vicinamibacterales bacterium]
MLPAHRPLADASRQTESVRNGAPRIVAIGGGTGLPNVLRGLRPLLYDVRDGEGTPPRDRLVAVVATSDDGGSSGRLRAEFNIVPPGDIRNCLAALSDNHALIADIFQYRFGSGQGLNGHPIGNLVITALADVTNDFARAVEIAARVVGARGTVLPATREMVTLVAEFEDGRVVSGETAISRGGGRIRQLSLLPERPHCLPDSSQALLKADVIVAGPGSLYTSILPPLLVPELRDAMHKTRAIRIFVANLMTEPGETDDYTALDQLLAIERHLGAQLFDCVMYNTSPVPEALAASYAARGARPVVTGNFELAALERFGIRPIGVPLVSEHPAGKIRHHPDRLAAAIIAMAHGKLGAWRSRVEAGGI